VCIEDLNENNAEEHHFVEAQIVQKDARRRMLLHKKNNYSQNYS
jgi:hypothetical protein